MITLLKMVILRNFCKYELLSKLKLDPRADDAEEDKQPGPRHRQLFDRASVNKAINRTHRIPTSHRNLRRNRTPPCQSSFAASFTQYKRKKKQCRAQYTQTKNKMRQIKITPTTPLQRNCSQLNYFENKHCAKAKFDKLKI